MATLDCIHRIHQDMFEFKDILPYIVSIGLAIWNFNLLKKIEGIKADNEKKLHVHKTQFYKEFDIYSGLWSQLVDIRITIEMLRPLLDNNDQGKTYEETINSRITIAIEKGNKFIASTEKNKPFYGKQVYDNLTDIISIIKSEIFEMSNRDQENRNYWDERKVALQLFTDKSDIICESIRQRIGQLNQM